VRNLTRDERTVTPLVQRPLEDRRGTGSPVRLRVEGGGQEELAARRSSSLESGNNVTRRPLVVRPGTGLLVLPGAPCWRSLLRSSEEALEWVFWGRGGGGGGSSAFFTASSIEVLE